MGFSFFANFFKFLKQKHVQIILDVFRIVSAISFLVSVFGLFFFTLGYSFLYGYFLSGDDPTYQSILSVVINPIPFNYYTVLITSLLLILSIIFVMSSTYVVKNGVVYAKLSVSIFFLVFHVCLSIFFVNGSDLLNKAISFSIIWAVPIFICIMMFWTIRSPSRMGLSFSGTLYGLYIVFILSKFYDWYDSVTQLTVPLAAFLLGIIFTFMKKSWFKFYHFKYIIIFPYAMLGLVVLLLLVDKLIKLPSISLIWFLILSAVVTFIISFRKIQIKDMPQDKEGSTPDSYVKILDQAGKASILTILCIVVVALGIITPNLALIGGQYIRQFTTDESRELQVIKDYDKGVTIKGNIISIKDRSYYISNEKWKLEIITGDKIYVEPDSEGK